MTSVRGWSARLANLANQDMGLPALNYICSSYTWALVTSMSFSTQNKGGIQQMQNTANKTCSSHNYKHFIYFFYTHL